MKIPRSTIWRILLSVAALLLALAAFFFATRPKPILTFRLADETLVAIDSIQYGKEFRLYSGTSLQQSFFKVFGDKGHYKLVGSESSFPARNTNAVGKSLGLVLRHFAPHEFLTSAWNGNQAIVLITPQGVETAGNKVLVNFDTEFVSEKTKVKVEQILWEFPSSTNQQLHFRLYDTNEISHVVTTNDFFLANPDDSPQKERGL